MRQFGRTAQGNESIAAQEQDKNRSQTIQQSTSRRSAEQPVNFDPMQLNT